MPEDLAFSPTYAYMCANDWEARPYDGALHLCVASHVPHAGGVEGLVPLDPDHPGFRDADYRARRNQIADLAIHYHEGDPPPAIEYTASDHALWRVILAALVPLHLRYAASAYLASPMSVFLRRDLIPQLAEVNTALVAATGFSMLPVAGLVSAKAFLSYLERDVFLSTQYIRHTNAPFYTPEPDIVHELIGHAVSLGHPAYAELNRAFGRAASIADGDSIKELERLYWYTLEFGVVQEAGELKAYGAGLLSSYGELERFSTHAELLPFDIAAMCATSYDPTQYQRTLFVATSFSELADDLLRFLKARGAR